MKYVAHFEGFLEERFSLMSYEPGSRPVKGKKIILELLIYKIRMITCAAQPSPNLP